MNNEQKAFLIVGAISLTVFLITLTFYGLESPFYDLKNITRWAPLPDTPPPPPNYVIRSTNWLGIISTGSLIGSIVGFFLFKDK